MNRRVFLLLALPTALIAGILPRLSVEELIDNSLYVVEGKVGRSWSAWDSKHKYIWTHYEIQVSDTLRGPRSQTITVSEPGGSVDGVNMGTSGTVPYSTGEDVILFLYRTPIGYLRTVGAGQGKFTVGKDGRARANMQGLEFVGPEARGTSLSVVDGLSARDFKTRMRVLTRTRTAPKEN